MANRSTVLKDLLNFLKTDLLENITDPISSKRSIKSSFIMTSYPQRKVQYPLITIRITNVEAYPVGMQSSMADIKLTLEIRIWARNQKEKDEIYNEVMERLLTLMYESNGSIKNDFHDFKIFSSVEVDEPGEGGIKSRIMQLGYSFFNEN